MDIKIVESVMKHRVTFKPSWEGARGPLPVVKTISSRRTQDLSDIPTMADSLTIEDYVETRLERSDGRFGVVESQPFNAVSYEIIRKKSDTWIFEGCTEMEVPSTYKGVIRIFKVPKFTSPGGCVP